MKTRNNPSARNFNPPELIRSNEQPCAATAKSHQVAEQMHELLASIEQLELIIPTLFDRYQSITSTILPDKNVCTSPELSLVPHAETIRVCSHRIYEVNRRLLELRDNCEL